MATETIHRLVDDLDGSDAAGTYEYEWQGQRYAIDLSDKNAKKFADAIAPYVSASRKVGRGASSSRGKAKSSEVDMRAVRAWAEANGVEVSPRGRISGKVLEQYRAAQ